MAGLSRRLTRARDALQELRELGLQGSVFRIGWELRTRSGLQGRFAKPPTLRTVGLKSLPFADPREVVEALGPHVPEARIDALVSHALDATQGRILCFSRWTADYGNPPDWHLNPVTKRRWDPDTFWSRALARPDVGDIKLTWEIGRFPQAYWMARAAAWRPELADRLALKLAEQIASFVDENPWPLGVHWNSGQEIAFRLMAWLFARDVLLRDEASETIARALHLAAFHVEQHIDYARIAVHNNHALSEALLLYLAGVLLPASPDTARWRALGREILVEQTKRQFYADGGYIQQSHTYQRVALQVLAWACLVSRAEKVPPDASWIRAMDRSIQFLYAHQNPADGWLPNYGNNDGAQPSIWSTCDYPDFRPVLQLASTLARGERLYPPGPWDEEAAWVLGPSVLELPLRPPQRRSVSFPESGHHVLRGDRVATQDRSPPRQDPSPPGQDRSPPGQDLSRAHAGETFAALRCGTLRDRFSQIDMLHLDLWWRGLNVLVDGGSYLYNGPQQWHAHFMRTASHNTVTVDGLDQMLHHRRFKVLYRTRAALLRFDESSVAGEHYGYRRQPGGVTHRRSVLRLEDDLWVVADTLLGAGEHSLRLHWLGGDFPCTTEENGLRLHTPEGPFEVRVFDESARPLPASVVVGQEEPPRGWLSRWYGDKTPVPSLAVERRTRLPGRFLTLLSCTDARLERTESGYEVTTPTERHRFTLEDGVAVSLATGSHS